ncbi:MAG: hypothetical protein ACLQVG_12560 [Terriglobia bacterium]
MQQIKWTRVLLGGFVAGLLINVFVLGPALAAAHLSLGSASTATLAAALLVAALVFFVTFMVTWIYAAIRPRYGPGLKTGAMAGISAALVLGFFEYIEWVLTSRMIPAKVWATNVAITSLALLIASLIGAWVYEKHSS